ncbi:hypothetical protein GT020_09595 [Glutamicibacter soli]|uniref:Uncharacterized protein n=1 Tax=Glutamicibacter soli TaxID=453836 RepID=A0A6L9G5F9_9MICC|nr:DUF4913 domain-containing protein [Glutamicibacter soli]NAZ16317.1 hypothetical protein [Glutamicibacter soli]
MIGIPPNNDELDLDGDETQEQTARPAAPSRDTGHAEPERPFVYEDAQQRLRGYALPRYLRKYGPSGRAWAPNWHEYPEVYSVITAL